MLNMMRWLNVREGVHTTDPGGLQRAFQGDFQTAMRRKLWGRMSVCSLLGLGLSGIFLVWQERVAEEALVALTAQSVAQQTASLTAAHTVPDAAVDLATLQRQIASETLRVDALTHQQSLRQDMAQVQSVLFRKQPMLRASLVSLHTLHWLGSAFEWEGTASSSEPLQNLLVTLADHPQLSAWQSEPHWVHIQSSMPPNSPLQNMGFRMAGQLQSAELPIVTGVKPP